jgi:hypothetical protein
MGSVQSDCICPQCKNPNAMEDLYYKSDEVYVFCNRCGYSYERTIKRDNNGELILKCPECEHIGICSIKGELTIKSKDIDKIKEYAEKNKIKFKEETDKLVFKPNSFRHDYDKTFLLHLIKDLKTEFEDNITKHCSNCNHIFDDIREMIIYDEKEVRGKGSLTIAGIIFTCPICKQDTCPDFKDGIYYCKNRECGKPFDEETAKKMIKRKQISGIHSVHNIPDTVTDEEIQKWINDINNDECVVIVDKQIWDGKPYEER